MKEKVTGVQTENTDGKDKVGILLMMIHFVCILLAVVLVGQLLYLWLGYKPNDRVLPSSTPRLSKIVTDPVRGSILDKNGKLLAVSVPNYQIHIDCTVMKEEFARDEVRGAEREAEWRQKADALSKGLAEIFQDKSAKEYYNLIINGRNTGKKYLEIGYPVNHETILKLRELPLFNESSYRGGRIETKIDTRDYPYGTLARRVIGYVHNNNERNSNVGIEGKFDYVLHGNEGVEWLKLTDARELVRDYGSPYATVENGYDVRTTIDIDIQDIVDRALRAKIMENNIIEGGCAIVMDVKTGGIRAMVNLRRDEAGYPGETYNYAIGRAGDPGSVFKLATLMTLLEDGKISSLEEVEPTYNGHWTYNKKPFYDEHIDKNHWFSPQIRIIDGFRISSNNVFRQLACKYYGDNPKRFTDKLYEYKLAEAFDFDIAGAAAPELITPDSPNWSGTALPSIAIGYSVPETPLHIITLYNAVANKGKLMKPYLVEDVEKDGIVKEKFGPEILNGAICSRATADTLLRALKAVTSSGTGKELKNAKCQVAGKTGTAQITFPIIENGKTTVVYKDKNGNHQNQGTFVGFFPADDPKYTAIVVLYSKRGPKDLYGAAAVPAFKSIVNEIYALSNDWGEELTADKKQLRKWR